LALTPADKQKRYRERQKAQVEAERLRPAADVLRQYAGEPFFAFVQRSANMDGFEIPLHLANIVPPTFDDDSPAVFPVDLDGLALPENATNSLGRAELIISCLLDAAGALAGEVQAYKLDQLAAEEARLNQAAETADAEGRRKIVADLLRLEKLRNKLNSNVRWTLPQWQVKDA
jgi:hypothetical protein